MSTRTKNIITGVIAVACATLIDLLSKGSWAHAVWVPTAIFLVTDLQKALGVDATKLAQWSHIAGMVIGIGSAVASTILTKGPLSGAVWVPSALMVLTEIKQIFSSSNPAPILERLKHPRTEAETPPERPGAA